MIHVLTAMAWGEQAFTRQSLTVKPSIQMSTLMVVSWPSFGADFLGFSIFNQSQKQNRKKHGLCFCHKHIDSLLLNLAVATLSSTPIVKLEKGPLIINQT